MSRGLADDEFTAVENQFTEKVETDAKGHADLSVDLPEGGGRQTARGANSSSTSPSPAAARSSAWSTLPVRAKGAMIGVKKDFDEALGAGDPATFEAIAVAADGDAHRAQGRRMVAL